MSSDTPVADLVPRRRCAARRSASRPAVSRLGMSGDRLLEPLIREALSETRVRRRGALDAQPDAGPGRSFLPRRQPDSAAGVVAVRPRSAAAAVLDRGDEVARARLCCSSPAVIVAAPSKRCATSTSPTASLSSPNPEPPRSWKPPPFQSDGVVYDARPAFAALDFVSSSSGSRVDVLAYDQARGVVDRCPTDAAEEHRNRTALALSPADHRHHADRTSRRVDPSAGRPPRDRRTVAGRCWRSPSSASSILLPVRPSGRSNDGSRSPAHPRIAGRQRHSKPRFSTC